MGQSFYNTLRAGSWLDFVMLDDSLLNQTRQPSQDSVLPLQMLLRKNSLFATGCKLPYFYHPSFGCLECTQQKNVITAANSTLSFSLSQPSIAHKWKIAHWAVFLRVVRKVQLNAKGAQSWKIHFQRILPPSRLDSSRPHLKPASLGDILDALEWLVLLSIHV